MTMMQILRVLLLLSCVCCRCHAANATASSASAASVESVPLGSITMQFQSQAVAKDAAAFAQTLLSTTLDYLNEYFTIYYSNGFQLVTLQIQADHVDTSSNGYGTYAAQVTFNGTAVFSTKTLPTQDQVSNLLAYAFQQQNRKLYVNKLLATSDTYLQRLTYFVVSINSFVISDGQQNGLVQNNYSSESHHVDWERVVIISCSVAGGLLIIACCIMVVFCCWAPKEMVLQMDRGHDKMERGVIGGPGPLALSPRSMSYHHRRQQQQQGNKNDNDNDLDAGSTRSPSPVRSLVSQDSSNFTYNPRSKASLETRQTMSMVHIDVSHSTIDIEAWKNHNNMISPVTPAPFNGELSAIECTNVAAPATTAAAAAAAQTKRGSSLVHDDDLKENDGPSHHVIVTTTNYLTKNSLEDHNTRPITAQTGASSLLVLSPNQSDDELSAAQSDDSDVIRDLNKLSRQFDKYRGRR